MCETREQHNKVHARVKELEQLRSQWPSSGVSFNISNNQATAPDKLKSKKYRCCGTTLPQAGREATRQEKMHAYQRYRDRAQAQVEDGPTAADATDHNPTSSQPSSSNQSQPSSNTNHNTIAAVSLFLLLMLNILILLPSDASCNPHSHTTASN
jgi:hypothetical protein